MGKTDSNRLVGAVTIPPVYMLIRKLGTFGQSPTSGPGDFSTVQINLQNEILISHSKIFTQDSVIIPCFYKGLGKEKK